MARKLTLRDVPRTDDAPPLGVGPVERWVVDGLPDGERAEIAEFNGRWRIMWLRASCLKDEFRDFPAAEPAFAVLVEEYAERRR